MLAHLRLGGLLCASVFFLSACFMPEVIVESDKAAKSLEAQGLIESHFLGDKSASLHYVLRPSEANSMVIFIHGTPGDWKIFSPQLESESLQQIAKLVAVDRPGWGGSQSEVYEFSDTLTEQAHILGPALRQLKQRYSSNKLVLVGHSFGASLAAKLAMDFPEIMDAVILLAGDLSNDYPAARWYNTLASWQPLAWLLSEDLLKSNREVLALGDELGKMKNQWANIKVPLWVVQGGADSLVDPRNADFAASLKTPAPVKVLRIERAGHLLHLTHADTINALIATVVEGN